MMIEETILGIRVSLATDESCFSPKSVDQGTKAMLSRCPISSGQKVLDLGCGYGVVGIVCAHFTGQENVTMSDVDRNAVSLAALNAQRNNVPGVKVIQSDGFREIEETGFDLILCNPPYHADFAVPKHFIEKGFNRLKIGGKMFMVTKRLTWYKRKLTGIFGGVILYREGDYTVFESEKTGSQYATRSGAGNAKT